MFPYFLSSSSLWWQCIERALTLSPPRAPWPSPCPRQGSRTLRSVASRLPTRGARPHRSHHFGASGWGKGPASLGFFPPRADCCQTGRQGLKHPMCPTRPRTLSRSYQMFCWEGPCRSHKQRSVFSQECQTRHGLLTTIERNLHGLGGIYFGCLCVAEQSARKQTCTVTGKMGLALWGHPWVFPVPMWSTPCLGAPG